MEYKFHISPANALVPGVTVTPDSIYFSAIFRSCKDCGLILYRLPDFKKVTIPFGDDCRFGSLYSVKIIGIDPTKWCYRYYRDEISYTDSYAREFIEIKEESGTVFAAGFFPKAEDTLPAYHAPKSFHWRDELILCLHVKGYTKLDESVAFPGTFSALIQKIPYIKSLGATMIELMPIYEIRPEKSSEKTPPTIADAMHAYSYVNYTVPYAIPSPRRDNYWGFGEGYYFAPKKTLSAQGSPQIEFAELVDAMHAEQLSVILQLNFPESIPIQEQVDAARFYVTHYGVDGFHMIGSVPAISAFATDPILSDTLLLYHEFPYGEICVEDEEFPTSGTISTKNLAEYKNVFSTLLRRFVKSDDYTMRDFISAWSHVSTDHGNIHYVTSYDGFTLNDLVSYTERHNEDNGEGGLDGSAENFSWNCGEEGPTNSEEISSLRRKQIRNFLTLLLLSQGTPVLQQGDEKYRTQEGNNNPYCQDNEITWVDWTETTETKALTDFVRSLISLRKEHSIFRMHVPFRGNDYLGTGFPDISYHGKEAWMPDFGSFSHTIGICICENYGAGHRDKKNTDLMYLAINMHWEEQELALPKLPPHRRWSRIADTSLENSFLPNEDILFDQHSVIVAPRSIQILHAVTSDAPVKKRVTVSGLEGYGPKETRNKGVRAAILRNKMRANSAHTKPEMGDKNEKEKDKNYRD